MQLIISQPTPDRALYNQVKRDILEAINEIRKRDPDFATHLDKNILFDDLAMTFQYVGDVQFDFGDLQ
jgi:hypothetical protein